MRWYEASPGRHAHVDPGHRVRAWPASTAAAARRL